MPMKVEKYLRSINPISNNNIDNAAAVKPTLGLQLLLGFVVNGRE